MIDSAINEISVWLDSLEDQNTDISLQRILCSYNYLSPMMLYGVDSNIELSFDIITLYQKVNNYIDINNVNIKYHFGNDWNGGNGHGYAYGTGFGYGPFQE